jgi:hypothetical protein
VPRVNSGSEDRKSTHPRAVGEHNERPEVVVAMPDGLEVDGTPRPRGRLLLREGVVY